MDATQAAKAVPITERLRNIKIGSYTVDHGSHTKHIAVRAICEEAAAEIERSHQREAMMKGECLLLADVLRDAFEVVKTVEGEEQDECDKLTGLCLSIAHALALYDDERIKRIKTPNVELGGLTAALSPEAPLERRVRTHGDSENRRCRTPDEAMPD